MGKYFSRFSYFCYFKTVAKYENFEKYFPYCTQHRAITTTYLGLSIVDLNKTVLYESCYDYAKSKYAEKAKLCYRDTGNKFHCIDKSR